MQAKNFFRLLIYVWFTFGVAVSAMAQENAPKTMEWTINGEVRKALVYVPNSAKNKPTPLIFAFHGHGGTMFNMFRTRGFDKLWPEAIFICPQGLNTPGMLTDPEGKKSGWVMTKETNNRDLQFFDAMLQTLDNDYKIDHHRIYATGHSNGGGFTYLLWATRANTFAAFAPTATAAGKWRSALTPKPALHLMGEADPLVKPWMQKVTYQQVLTVNGCGKNGVKLDSNATLYAGKNGNDVVIYRHSGGHEYPREANQAIINFFKKYAKN